MTSQKFIIFFHRKKLRTSDKKTDQEICVNQRDAAVFRDQRAAFGVIFLKKTSLYKWSRGVCVPNIRSVSFFVWSVGEAQTHTPTDIYTSKYKITTACAPHLDSTIGSYYQSLANQLFIFFFFKIKLFQSQFGGSDRCGYFFRKIKVTFLMTTGAGMANP